MDNQRLLVWATFGMLAWLTYQAWQADHAVPPASESQAPTEEGTAAPGAIESLPSLPDAAVDSPQEDAQTPSLDVELEPAPRADSGIVRVTTDVLEVEINTRGATLQRAVLSEYPVNKDEPDTLVELLSTTGPDRGQIQTGLIAEGDAPEPNHLALFSTQSTEYELNGGDEIVVPFTWTDGQGVSVEKELRFTRGSYREVERSMFNVDSYSFDGPIIYDGDKSEKLDRDDLISDGPYDIKAGNGWVGSIQHHFLSAVVPSNDAEYRYKVAVNDATSVASLIRSPSLIVRPGTEYTFETSAFVGPKLQSQLEELDESLKLTVDYGWLTIISQPLFWLLSKVYSVVANWGVAIILVTVLIKLAFYKLTEASGRSMAKMREIQPRMKALQDRYKDDRQALSQAMMELYKREQVNPAAGCLPILIQMPFFLAFYWVLLESVEMRQAPFALWITDLSSRDPYFILPLIMGAAMLFQQRLNPAPADPVQAKVMQIMPIMFTAFFASKDKNKS
jgi:YidC/Oxa1 family membrane protein insertase